jgi:Domain of unknown function (DUF4263)
MARISSKISDRNIKDLVIVKKSQNCVIVNYETSGKTLIDVDYSEETDKEYDYIDGDYFDGDISDSRIEDGIDNDVSNKNEPIKSLKLLDINYEIDLVHIYPRRISPDQSYFSLQKYGKIQRISLDGFKFNKSKDGSQIFPPKNYHEVLRFLEQLPTGFMKDYEYGLGLLGRYKYIVDVIQKNFSVNNIIISVHEETSIVNNTYTLNAHEFHDIRKRINRIHENNKLISRTEKERESFNYLISRLDPFNYDEILAPVEKNAISNLASRISATNSPLSKADQLSVIHLMSDNTKDIYRNNGEILTEIAEEIEFLNMESLINKMKEMLSKNNIVENRWQKLLNDNPFIIQLVFGYPVVKIGKEVHVGGRKTDGKGDKIVDFLMQNSLTNNTALVEIKTPGTKLVGVPYRGGICPPSTELCGAINQVLDQKYLFQKEIGSLKENTRQYDMESYSVECILIIGKIPETEDQKKSFELFRHNSKDVKIFTFDELLGRLEDMYRFMKGRDSLDNFDDIPF